MQRETRLAATGDATGTQSESSMLDRSGVMVELEFEQSQLESMRVGDVRLAIQQRTGRMVLRLSIGDLVLADDSATLQEVRMAGWVSVSVCAGSCADRAWLLCLLLLFVVSVLCGGQAGVPVKAQIHAELAEDADPEESAE